MTARASAAVILVGMLAFGTGAAAADRFQKLNGSQIRAQFTGMELSDGTHWTDAFGEGGVLTSFSMSKKRTGKWSVQKDRLCLDLEKEISSCFEVWLSGKMAQLKHSGSDMPFLEGVLRKPSAQR
jgi:hypothetical protein